MVCIVGSAACLLRSGSAPGAMCWFGVSGVVAVTGRQPGVSVLVVWPGGMVATDTGVVFGAVVTVMGR